MLHQEFRKLVPNAKTAVLFIHGIVGSPNHFAPLLPLVPEQFSVCNLLLDGHGKGVRDFSHTSMKKWETQVQEAVAFLSREHDSIYIVAHSMGTLFAVEQAIQSPKVKKLFLLAMPIKLFLKPAAAINSAKVLFGKIDPDDPVLIAAKRCYGIEEDKNLLKYIGWVPRYLELFQKIIQTQNRLPHLCTSCQVYQSYNDELVSRSSIPYLENFGSMSVNVLKDSSHYYYGEEDQEFLRQEFCNYIN